MGKRSRDKGKRGEREAAEAVRLHLGFTETRRAAQANGSYSADLISDKRLHFEVKRLARVPATDFMHQAVEDADPKQIPLVLFREDHEPDWILMVRLQDAKALSEVLSKVS